MEKVNGGRIMKPIISIIVPVYNVEKYVAKCIESIIKQDMEEIELLMIDDGSTDNSGKICDEWAAKDSRIKVMHIENRGVSSARNLGLELAQGEYIGFVDSDDYIHKSMYRVLYNTLIEEHADMVVCDFAKVYEGEKTPVNEQEHIDIYKFTNMEALMQLHKESFKWNIVVNKLYKRELFKEVRFTEGIIFEDMDIMHKIIYQCEKILYINQTYYYYYQRSGSILRSEYTLKKIDKVKVLEDRMRFAMQIKNKEFRQATEKLYIDALFHNYVVMRFVLKMLPKQAKIIKKGYTSFIPNLLANPNFGLKHKIAMVLFWINTRIYDVLVMRKVSE